jgi:hypothetical protein
MSFSISSTRILPSRWLLDIIAVFTIHAFETAIPVPIFQRYSTPAAGLDLPLQSRREIPTPLCGTHSAGPPSSLSSRLKAALDACEILPIAALQVTAALFRSV